MADAVDSKSTTRQGVWVRLPPPAPARLSNEKNLILLIFCLELKRDKPSANELYKEKWTERKTTRGRIARNYSMKECI